MLKKKRVIANELFRRVESLAAVPSRTTKTITNDLSIIKRVVEAYRRSADETENQGDSMWKIFFDQCHVELHKIFMHGNLDEAAAILRNPGASNLFYGFDNLVASLHSHFKSTALQQNHANECLDCLVRFAEAIGALPLDYPYNHSYTPPISWQADAIVDKIIQALGMPITFPNPYPDELGVLTSYGIISYRVPQSLYQAYRLKQLLRTIENPRVLEIGAGLGRTAYYARALGIQDYTIVDLPFSALSSGYFLGCTLGEDQILYSGEQVSDSRERIKILTPAEFFASNKEYDLIINADGLTEMDPMIAKAYWDKIEKSTPLLLSINHEANIYRIKSLIDESLRILESERNLYWLRKGYVEEIVRFKT